MEEKNLDRISQAYKGELGKMSEEDAKKRIDWIRKNVVGDRILDIGCSQGTTSILLAKEDKNVIGIDSEISRIEYAEKDKEKEQIGNNLKFICDDFLAYDFNVKFDTIIMAEVLEHVFSPELFLDKALKLLNKNGRIIITVPFGINPFPDHKRTYYFLELFKQINKRIFVSDVVFIESWIGFIADLSNKENRIVFDEKIIEKLENGFYKVDSRKQENIDRINSWYKTSNTKNEVANNKINELEERLENIVLQNKAQKEKIDELKEKYNQLSKEKEKSINELELVIRQKRDRLDTLQNDYIKKTADFNILNEEYLNVLKHNYELENENKLQSFKLDGIKEENKLKENQLIELLAKLSTSQEDLLKSKAVIEINNEKLHDLKKEIDKLQSELEIKEQYTGEKEVYISELEVQIQELVNKIDKSDNELESIQSKFEEINDKLVKAQAGVETRNKKIKNAEEKITKIEKENDTLQKKLAEFNNMLYKAKKLNAAYERFPSIKLYNWARKFKNKNAVNVELQDVQNTASNMVGITGKQIEQTSVVAIESKAESAKTAQSDKTNVESKSVKVDFLFSDFIEKRISSDDQVIKFHLRDDCEFLRELKVACIMDEFTFSCFAPECNILQLTPDKWQAEMEEFVPDMMFVESAWLGKNGEWYGMVVKTMPVFRELIEYCKAKKIPVIFWNKEDPAHNQNFMTTAGLCDFVFTTEIDCIAQYKRCLGHNRVYLSHFAAQPMLHNPIETFERKDVFCFAGSYYTNYPERTRIFNNMAHYAMRIKGLDIYDRNYNNPKADHQFPEFYKPFILGRLEPEEIEKAYKGYTYNINANSVILSQTMFARRVFELLASNSISVGNFSRGVRNLFGDLTICTDSINEVSRLINKYCNKREDIHRYRLQGFRKVSEENLYEDRLDYMVKKVFGVSLKKQLPKITIVGIAKDKREFNKIINMAQSQNYSDIMIRIKPEFDIEYDENLMIPRNITINDYLKENIKEGFIAYFSAADFYGENYLRDMAIMLRYGAYEAIGKASHYDNKGILKEEYPVYHKVPKLMVKKSIISVDIASEIIFKENTFIENSEYSMISIHEFDYVENSDVLLDFAQSKMDIEYPGISYKLLEKESEKIELHNGQAYSINPKLFFKEGKYAGAIELNEKEKFIQIKSFLKEESHNYIYSKEIIKCNIDSGDFTMIMVEGGTSLDVMISFICLDRDLKSIGTVFASAGLSKKAELPQGTEYIKMALRVKGSGESYIGNIRICKSEIGNQDKFIAKSNTLILTNIYPSYDNLYRNMFVHKRVLGYKESGIEVDVMCFNNDNKPGYREFEGIDIINGFTEELKYILSSGDIDTVCVHFLNKYMWDVLKQFKDKIRIIVWCHGSDIQPWWRRKFMYETEEGLEQGKKDSEERMSLWNEVFSCINECNIHFVFVSNYFKNTVFEDYKINLPEDKYSIIHNYIDTEMFKYEEKSPEQRKHILSIRPFASNIYANDLTVQCIKELSKKTFFNELQFHIIGRGKLFEPLMQELEEFDNVKIENRFLQQWEIAELHKNNGIFLVPTRLDSQGVSRDEAMSSGLVPITNAVAAVPEFVDDSCGIMAGNEDYKGLANGIEKLYYNSKLFEDISKKAAVHVRKISSKDSTIMAELDLIKGSNKWKNRYQ